MAKNMHQMRFNEQIFCEKGTLVPLSRDSIFNQEFRFLFRISSHFTPRTMNQISIRYTHKTSGFKMSGFKTSGFKTSETSGLQNIRFTKHQVVKTSGLQNVRLQKNIHIYSVFVVGRNPQVLFRHVCRLCFILYFREFFAIYHHNR
jgi:hypothetical protein